LLINEICPIRRLPAGAGYQFLGWSSYHKLMVPHFFLVLPK
jgi:hypothetical protein